MKVYQINYDLRKQRNYEELNKKIKAYGTWCRPLKSCWIIASDKSAMQILNDLRQALDNDDGLLVTRLQRDAAWVNLDSDKDKSMTDWLKKYVGNAP